MAELRRHRVRNLTGSFAFALALTVLSLTITKGTEIYGGNATLAVLWSAVGLSAFAWFLSTDLVARRFPVRWVGFGVKPEPNVEGDAESPRVASWRDAARRRIKRKLNDLETLKHSLGWAHSYSDAELRQMYPDDAERERFLEWSAKGNEEWLDEVWAWHQGAIEELHAIGGGLRWLYSEEAERPTGETVNAFVTDRDKELSAIIDRL